MKNLMGIAMAALFAGLASAAGAGESLLVLKGSDATLTFDAHGRASSLKENATGRELLKEPQPMVTVIRADGKSAVPSVATVRDGLLVYSFGPSGGEAAISVTPFEGGWTFAVDSFTVPDVQTLLLCQLHAVCAKWNGAFANMASDETSGVALRAYDLPMAMFVGGGRLRVQVSADDVAPAARRKRPDMPFAGWRFGLSAGPRTRLMPMLRAMAVAAGVPYSTLGGPWSLGAEETRGSYLFADLAHAATDDWIDLARRGGFSTIHLHGWWNVLGHYPFRPAYFPKGMEDFADATRRIHAAGLRVGMHTLTACISPRDAWVTPECSTNLLAWHSYTLARPLAPDAKEIVVNEKPGPKHDLVFTYSGNGNAIRIGTEIVQYTGIGTNAPWTFTGCTRGAFGTRPQAHAAGDRADYLQQRYIAFYPDPDSPLADELAEAIGRVYRGGDVDAFYFDGSEGMMSRYGIDAMRRKIFTRLATNTLAEASCHGAHSWWYHSRIGAWDHSRWAAKRFHDRHVASTIPCRESDLLAPQMGWWAPRRPDAAARGHFLDEMEYFAAKNAGHDAAMSIQGVNVSYAPLPTYVESQLTVMGWYERFRMARAFADGVPARLAEPGAEFRLRQGTDGAWGLTPAREFAHRVSGVGNGTEAWRFEAKEARRAALRVEALWCTDASKPAKTLLDASDAAPLETAAAGGVVIAAGRAKDAARGDVVTLVATNRMAARRGAWARATRAFGFPYLDLSGCGAFGVWVKGDGKGALLNVQVESAREYIPARSDHYVRVDFTGWRYVELLARERDVGEMHNFVWPYAGSYFLYRNSLDMKHVSAVHLFLNEVPANGTTEIAVATVRALPVKKTTLEKPVVTLNGVPHAVPFALASGDFAEWDGGAWEHRAPDGELLGRVADARPVKVNAGANTAAFAATATDGTARAEVTFFSLGEVFPALRADLSADQRRQLAYEAMEPLTYCPAKGLASLPPLKMRPGERADVSVELWGPIARPTLTIGSEARTFPADVAKGARLQCRDGRSWRVLDAQRKEVASGMLEKPLPAFGGVLPIALACERPDAADARLKLVKNYR